MAEVRETEKVMFSGAMPYEEWSDQNNDRIMNELEQSGFTREMGNDLEAEFEKRYDQYLLEHRMSQRPDPSEESKKVFEKALIGMTPLSVPNVCLAQGRKCGKLCFICTCSDLQH